MTRRWAGLVTMGAGAATIGLAVLAAAFDVTWKLLFGLGLLAFIAGLFVAFRAHRPVSRRYRTFPLMTNNLRVWQT